METKKSMIDLAYEIASKSGEAHAFKDLYEEVALILEFNDEEKAKNIGQFYTELTLDGRFVNLGDNTWDLRVNHTYEKSHIDVNDVYTEVDEDTDADEEDKKEEKEYNALLEGDSLDEVKETEGNEEDGDADKLNPEDVSTLIGK